MTTPKSRYHDVYGRWQNDPQGFWGEAAQAIDWIEKPKNIFDAKAGIYGRWFPDAVCNTCYNAIDRHVLAGRGQQAALIYDSPVTNTKQTFTYGRLLSEVQLLGAMLRDFGVKKGDVVILYMPMVPEAVFAMLACARIGAIHSVVFGGFAAKELATRINDCKPKMVLSASCGIEGTRVVPYKPLLDEAIRLATHKPEACLILQRPQCEAALVNGRDHDWRKTWEHAVNFAKTSECVPVLATDPLYILYTSGTTGIPKGVVRDNGGHMVALKWSMKNLYNIDPGEIFWCASDIGWVVGHSYIIYAPLFHGATSVLYEGKPVGTPDAGAFWRVCADHGVVALFTAPTAFRAIRKEDPDAKLLKQYDLSKFRTLFLAGERADAPTIQWAEEVLKVPVIDHWWQTETGWCIAGNPVGLGALPVKYGSACVPMPGYAIDIVDEANHKLPVNKIGSIVVRLPLPPASLPTLWHQDARMREILSERIPRLLQNRGCRLSRPGRLRLCHEPHRRHHQCRRPQALDRRHGRGLGRPSRCRRMRRARHQGRHEGRSAVRLHRLEGRRDAPARRDRAGNRQAGARNNRSGGVVQVGDHGGAPAQDALRKNPAWHHQENGRWRPMGNAGHHRRPGDPRRDRRGVEGEGRGRLARFTSPRARQTFFPSRTRREGRSWRLRPKPRNFKKRVRE